MERTKRAKREARAAKAATKSAAARAPQGPRQESELVAGRKLLLAIGNGEPGDDSARPEHQDQEEDDARSGCSDRTDAGQAWQDMQEMDCNPGELARDPDPYGTGLVEADAIFGDSGHRTDTVAVGS